MWFPFSGSGHFGIMIGTVCFGSVPHCNKIIAVFNNLVRLGGNVYVLFVNKICYMIRINC